MKVIRDKEGFDRVLSYWKNRGANMFKIDKEDERLILRLIRYQVNNYFTGKYWSFKIDDRIVRQLEVSPELTLPAEYFKEAQSL